MVKLAPYLVITALLGGCSDGCQNTVLASFASPNGRASAVLFQRDCGATTGFSTQISVVRGDAQPSGAGNAFVADDNHGAAEATNGGLWAEARWIDGSHLLVRYDAQSRIFKQEREIAGVQITYEAVNR
tara:strand:- start:178 stop:564 length:387 start_codon:yes stop_codon:yes gene_type:complete